MSKIKAKLRRKGIIRILLILILVFLFMLSTEVFAATIDKDTAASIEVAGVVSIFALALRGIFVIVWFAITLVVGSALTNSLTTLSIEDYIFNKAELTSLRVFTGSSGTAETAQFYEFVSQWFTMMMKVAIVIQLLIFIYIIIVTIIKSIRQDPKRDSEVKVMLKDFLLGVIILVGMSVFVITMLTLNNTIVDLLAKGLKADKLRTATNLILLGVFDVSIAIGTTNLILYIIITTMGLIFFFHYLRRLFKVSFLIIISPLVATTFSIDRRISGGATKLLTWGKMFIFAVFSQAIHALLYMSLIAVIVSSIRTSSTTLIPLVVISVAGLKFLWDSENIVSELFGMPIDKAQSSAGFMLGLIQTAGKLKSGKDKIVANAPGIRENTLFKDVGKKAEIKAPTLRPKVLGPVNDVIPTPKISDVVADVSNKASSAFVDRLTELGAIVKQSAEIKVKSITKEKTIKTFSKALGGTVLAIASHATPQAGMIVGATAGAAAGGAIHDAVKKSSDKRKYKGRGKEKTIDQEAAQLNAIADRKDFLERAKMDKESEKQNEEARKLEDKNEEEFRKLEQEVKKDAEEQEKKLGEQEKQEEKSEKKKSEKDDNQQEITSKESTAEQFTSEDVESYAKEIVEKTKKDIMDEYYIAKEDSINRYMEENDVNKATAIEYVEDLQKALLKDKEFDYRALNEADNTLLNKYLDLITKQKIEAYETHTKENEYNRVIERTRELRMERTQSRLELDEQKDEEQQEEKE